MPEKQIESGNRDPLFSVEGSAAYLGGISKHTVRLYLKRKKLKKTKVGARTFIRRSELDRFIRAGEAR